MIPRASVSKSANTSGQDGKRKKSGKRKDAARQRLVQSSGKTVLFVYAAQILTAKKSRGKTDSSTPLRFDQIPEQSEGVQRNDNGRTWRTMCAATLRFGRSEKEVGAGCCPQMPGRTACRTATGSACPGEAGKSLSNSLIYEAPCCASYFPAGCYKPCQPSKILIYSHIPARRCRAVFSGVGRCKPDNPGKHRPKIDPPVFGANGSKKRFKTHPCRR